jgi:N6-L-threonylcarbamoyladenine synthase
MSDPFYTLGIETSCDETAVALLEGEADLKDSLVYSQVSLHAPYGGVVPEIASRDHLRKLPFLVSDLLERTGVAFSELSLIAATYGPGLVGPLLVGLSYGKGVAFGLEKPFVGVNHLEGHLFAHRLSFPEVSPPFMGLIVSGGHTLLVRVDGYGTYQTVGETVDDAAGEALDKVGKLLEIGYPAGAEIDRLADEGNPTAIAFPRPLSDSPGFDFSFSGLKTSALYYLKRHPRTRREDVAASFLESVVDVLTQKSLAATRRHRLARLVVVGGVAANRHLRARLIADGKDRGIEVQFPEQRFCTDNAAMIAAAGAFHHLRGGRNDPLSLSAEPSLHL